MRRWAALVLLLSIVLTPLWRASAAAEIVQVSIGVGDNILVVSGKTVPSSFVTLERNTVAAATTTAGAVTGAYSMTLPAQEGGIQSYQVRARTPSGQYTDTVSVQVNVAEHATTTVELILPPTLQVGETTPEYGDSVPVSGQAPPGQEVLVYLDNAVYASVTADSQGNWSTLVSTAALAAGGYELFARTLSYTGEQSYPTAARHITVAADTSYPTAQPSGSRRRSTRAPQPPTITYPPTSFDWRQPTITIKGSAQPDTQLELWDGDAILGSVWTNARGEWQFALRLGKQDYSLRARACSGEVCGGFSLISNMRYLPSAPHRLPLSVAVQKSQLSIADGTPGRLRLTVLDGKAPFTITTRWGDGSHTGATSQSPHIVHSHTYDHPGRYVVTQHVQDATGRKATVRYAIEVYPTDAPALSVVTASLAILGVALIGWWAHRRLGRRWHKQKRRVAMRRPRPAAPKQKRNRRP